MNRSIDSRSDLYSLGIVFYQMLTGDLPLTASDPMEWVHCHIARQPVPPRDRLGNLPAPVAAIIMKLLAKTAEERYQTAAGLQHDLRHCLAAWEAQGRIDDFPLAARDTPDRLVITEKLYGQEREIETLRAAFDRVVKKGSPELVLVSGYSGIRKSAVVNGLHKALVLLAPGHRYCHGSGQAPRARPRPQGHQADQHPGEWRHWRGEAHRVRDCLAVTARAPVARASRDDRRHTRLYGARTDRRRPRKRSSQLPDRMGGAPPIEHFPLGKRDTPIGPLFPRSSTAYSSQVETLLASFDRTVKAVHRSWRWFPAIPASVSLRW